MAQAAYNKAVRITATGTTTWSVLPANSASLTLAGDILDDTDFSSTGYRSRILGLKDWSVSGTINYDDASVVVGELRSAWLNRTQLLVQYLPNGTVGFQGTIQVESLDLSGDVGSLESMDFSLQANGSLSTVLT